ncbi:hypothetical protein F751_1749 [Auxenochlorella protothecoides]|uniref:Uncharacterized protein n=1 Tax=Auxenochlorella protothecoides TaxID=3075 RepID=A0A087SGL6_AUXPR|nr:hypothetical protein F751_1749 [Auxenochlorella protothecoides]KFM24870.1 hypothetical protein F751_1749 [Auxenochlorella protothecoides]
MQAGEPMAPRASPASCRTLCERGKRGVGDEVVSRPHGGQRHPKVQQARPCSSHGPCLLATDTHQHTWAWPNKHKGAIPCAGPTWGARRCRAGCFPGSGLLRGPASAPNRMLPRA